MIYFELIVSVIIVLFGFLVGVVSTYLAVNILVKFFRERKSDPARTLTPKEIENLSLFLIGFAAFTFWITTFIKIIVELLGGR